MKTIAKNTEIIPGIPYVYAIPTSFITLINQGSIELSKPAAEIMYAFEKATDSDAMSINSTETDAGIHYNSNVRLFIPGLSIENISLLKELAMFKHVIIWKSYGGDYWRIGNKSHGLDFSYSQTTSPRIGYQITFSGNVLEPPKIVNPNSLFSE